MNYYKILSTMLMIAVMVMTAVAYREGQTISDLKDENSAIKDAAEQIIKVSTAELKDAASKGDEDNQNTVELMSCGLKVVKVNGVDTLTLLHPSAPACVKMVQSIKVN